MSNQTVRAVLSDGDTEHHPDSGTSDSGGQQDTALDGCTTTFTDRFSDEAGANPPAGWRHLGSDPTPVAWESDGELRIEADQGTTTVMADAATDVDPADVVTYTVGVAAFEPGGDATISVFALARDSSLVPSLEVQVFGSGRVQLGNDLQVGTIAEPPYTLTLWIAGDEAGVVTDHGLDSGRIPLTDIDPTFSREAFPEVRALLRVTSSGQPGDNPLTIDGVEVRVGPQCSISPP